MNLQQVLKRRIWWGASLALVFASFSPEVAFADEEGERERLNLYDRNRRTVRWQQERRDYFGSSSCCRGRGRNYYYRGDCHRASRCCRHNVEEADMAPPE